MKKITLLLLAIIFLLLSCNPPGQPINHLDRSGAIEAECRHTAILQYLIFNEFYETEIVWGVSSNGIYHAQTRVKIDGKWHWAKTNPITVSIGEQDDFEPFFYNVPIEEALGWCNIIVCRECFTEPGKGGY